MSQREPPPVVVPTDCTDCGCCCFSDEPGYIAVFEVDWQRMGERARALCEQRERGQPQRSMRFEGGRCSALVLDPGGGASCTIHPERPDACRWLEQGSGECRQQIAAKLQLVQLALKRL